VATCANQDPLLGTTGLVPLMGIDVWEHAYDGETNTSCTFPRYEQLP
jgi:hypothetical protein